LEEFDSFLLNCTRLINGTIEISHTQTIFSGNTNVAADAYWSVFLENINKIFNSLNDSERKEFFKYFWHMIILIHYLPYNPLAPPNIFSFNINMTNAADYRKHFPKIKQNYEQVKTLLGGII
jgi:hypothetical protein